MIDKQPPRSANVRRGSQPDSMAALTQQNVRTIAELEAAAHSERTRSDAVVDSVASFCGSLPFVWVHVVWFGGWILANTVPGIKHLDAFPFPLLTLVTSLESIFLTTFVLISQTHLGGVAERRNHLDLQINLLAEQENSKMLSMIRKMLLHMGIQEDDGEAHLLEEPTKPKAIVEQIQQTIEASDEKAGDNGGTPP